MATNVEIPALGESVSEAVIVRWHKVDGDQVQADEPLCELETDKANVDLPSPAAGVLRRIREEGDTVQVGEAVARIDEAGAAAPAKPKPKSKPAAAPSPAPPARDRREGREREAKPATPRATAAARLEDLSPSVRRIVEERQLDPGTIRGTGPGGRLTKEDVQRHLERADREEAAMPEDVEEVDEFEARRPAPEPAALPESTPAPQPQRQAPPAAMPFDEKGTYRAPMSKIRRRIAERLVAAQQTAAILTTFNEIDLTRMLELRARYKERFQEVHGVSLGLMSFFARACVLALHQFPRLNAEIDGNDIVYHQHVHLGIAVSTERGLAVPVLRNAQEMSFARIESEIKRLANATREGKLGLNELSGGTFTITNGGIFGSLLSTPILNPPQSGILGMHAIQKRPMVVDDKIAIRSMMYVALSYDHRLVDGRESVTFLVRLKELLEDPARLMLEI